MRRRMQRCRAPAWAACTDAIASDPPAPVPADRSSRCVDLFDYEQRRVAVPPQTGLMHSTPTPDLLTDPYDALSRYAGWLDRRQPISLTLRADVRALGA